MTKEWLTKKKRGAQFAILLTLSIATSNAAVCLGQVAGFAQSRPESAGEASSGATPRVIVNSVRTADGGQIVRRSSSISNESVSASGRQSSRDVSRQYDLSIGQRTSLSRPLNGRTIGGSAAAALLDEIEEDVGAQEFSPASRSGKNQRATERKSLRSNSASLELLSEDDGTSESDEYSEDENVVSTSDEDMPIAIVDGIENEEYVDADDEANAEEPAPVVTKKRTSGKRASKGKLAKTSVAPRTAAKVALNDETDDEYTGSVDAADGAMDRSISENVQEGEEDEEGMAFRVGSENVRSSSEGRGALATNVLPLYERGANVEVSALGPKRLIVGQAADYKVFVRNTGNEPARKLIVTTELPDSISKESAEPEIGSAFFEEAENRVDSKNCVWSIGTLEPGQEVVLALSLTPTRRAAFELVSHYDCERSTARADVLVQEAILETSIEGRDSIEWGVEDQYRIRVRNVGDGDAENVKLSVLVGENEASQDVGTLKPGEEKTIETTIKTTLEDSITIDVKALGAYGVKSETTKRIETLRGKLDVVIDVPDMQFVEGEFEATVHARNIGAASLQDVDVVAQLPRGIELIDCPKQARYNAEKRRVYWSAQFIRPDDEITFNLLCRCKDVGASRFELVGVDGSGAIAQSNASVCVEAIAVLAMRVKAPKEPVAIGKKCVYELVVENNGTRDAKDINSGMFLGAGLKPLTIDGDQGAVFERESKVLFNKIDCLRAGEKKTFRVEAQALAAGNQKVQAMLQSVSEDVSLLSEETTYCYSRAKFESQKSPIGGMKDEETVAERSDSRNLIRK